MRKYKFDVGDIIIYQRTFTSNGGHTKEIKFHLLVTDIDVIVEKEVGVYKKPKAGRTLIKKRKVKGYMTRALDGLKESLKHGTSWGIPKDECEEYCTLHA